jgi:hypothetical protein
MARGNFHFVWGGAVPYSKKLTRPDTITSRLRNAVILAGIVAGLFAPLFLLYLFATILMVGDGSGPEIMQVSSDIITRTVKFLGISSSGAVFPVALFWSLVVFVVVFLCAAIAAFFRGPKTREHP